jgi:hypothetical protein
MADDLSLRAPFPGALDGGTARAHNERVRPLLSGLLVAAHVLQLSTEATFTAAVLLHRYVAACFGKKGDDDEKYYEKYVAAACLFLACKAEEEPRRLRDVINCAHMIGVERKEKCRDSIPKKASQKGAQGDQAFVTEKPRPVNTGEEDPFEEQPARRKRPEADSSVEGPVTVHWNPYPPALDEAYWQAKESTVKMEQTILRWLAYDVSVSHPHRAVVLLLRQSEQRQPSSIASTSDDSNGADPRVRMGSEETRQLIRMAFRRLNDAVFSVQALQHPALALAAAAIQLAAREAGEQVTWRPPDFLSPDSIRAAVRSLETGVAASPQAAQESGENAPL